MLIIIIIIIIIISTLPKKIATLYFDLVKSVSGEQ
jgi:Sec-independent protein translocase protein TatA